MDRIIISAENTSQQIVSRHFMDLKIRNPFMCSEESIGRFSLGGFCKELGNGRLDSIAIDNSDYDKSRDVYC